MKQLSTFVLIALTIVVSAFYLPMLYEKLFFERILKTHLLYSPVTERFIFKEKIVGPIPQEAQLKAEDHHAEIAYRDANGDYYTRVEFEKNLPFIYYRNMELWGLLPLRFGDQEFGKKEIKENRQVLELKFSDISDLHPQTPLWPLLESNPSQARLVFPEDRFRMTSNAMEFVNADYNKVDEELTSKFTNALNEKGFVFPARSVHGKFTILKPFDEGAFIVDNQYQVFHVKRRNGDPWVIKTDIDPKLKTRHIKVSENRRRKYYGLLLAGTNDLHLLTTGNYGLIRLPLEDYQPNKMDFKLLINPLYQTAVYSDETTIRGVAMDSDFTPIDRYTHSMSRSIKTNTHLVHEIFFPFAGYLKQSGGAFLNLSLQLGSSLSFIGIAVCLVGFGAWSWLRRQRFPKAIEVCVVAVTGIYGVIAVSMLDLED